ncbi:MULTISPECIES: hypothetical protein [Actinomycetaceae]|uniref:SAF domain-containing protein n=2 Tax=Actinomycetaceae TaxID=2049 RepID=A0ABZ0RDN5_9ACTO|nr:MULTISPECIES: hypothetical protein [Actinotignum]WPJ89120.1 hypothetical protein R0V15_00555 [Schaalia turicensis]MDE1552791.1 hypothetical protein [Actinotignum sanguinis]MDE1564724.1 hypothetical protein [Actinotignum sanguinis]MDE1576759.1 hypothetical protein [Actinotignum sanguinis]MDE1642327.1 hypothetical protein [Actinotignum sanguinis]
MREKTGARWKDPRLAGGVALIAAGALAGAYVLRGPVTVPVYRATEAVVPGTPLDQAGLAVVELPAGLADAYIQAGHAGTVGRTIYPGELVEKSALRISGERVVAMLPLNGALPAALVRGAQVQLWALPAPGSAAEKAPARLISREVIFAGTVSDSHFAGTAAVEVHIPRAELGIALEEVAAGSSFTLVGEVQ